MDVPRFPKPEWTLAEPATDLDELIRQLRALREQAKGQHPLRCRGHRSSSWSLISTFDRRALACPAWGDRNTLVDIESRLAMDFGERAYGLLTRTEQMAYASGTIEQMALARHYGVANRLLDWTMSPFTAAYFACLGRTAEDGVVWWYSGSQFQMGATLQWQREFNKPGNVEAELISAMFGPYDRDIVSETFLPHGLPRMVAQNAMFTVSTRFGADHATLIHGLVGEGHCGGVLIPSTLKGELLDFLIDLNFSGDSVMTSDAHIIAYELNASVFGDSSTPTHPPRRGG